MLMVLGRSESRWQAREELQAAIQGAPVVQRTEVYRSCALRVARVATLRVGTYFIVTESRGMADGDVSALQRMSAELRAPWRNRVVETDFYDHPHRWFPKSTAFWVHVVHPEAQSDWGMHERPFFCAGHHAKVRQSSRAVREMSGAVSSTAA